MSPEEFWNWDGISIQYPSNSKEAIAKNPTWKASSVLSTILRRQAEQDDKIDRLESKIDQLLGKFQSPK